MEAVTHLERVIIGEASAVTHLEKVIAEETSAVTYTEKVIAGEAPPITHLEKVIAGTASPVTHLEQVWAGRTPEPTEHEYTGAVPITFTADGTPLLDYLISGNMTQTGTPTPDNPIQPQECGEKTENLFDYSAIKTGYRIVWKTGALYADSTAIISDFIEIIEGQRYKISDVTKPFTAYVIGYDQNKEYLGVYDSASGFVKASTNKYSILTIPPNSNCKYIKLMTFTDNNLSSTSMFTAGSDTPSEFIPYGCKLPITSAGHTNNIYLGEVPTTRRIKKIILNGKENWSTTAVSDDRNSFILILNNALDADTSHVTSICTHVPLLPAGGTYTTDNGYTITKSELYMRLTSTYNSLSDFKSYLAQQYAARTPVTVWYVLAEPETGTLNEPLRKIGEYADTLSMEQAGVQIPTNTSPSTTTIDIPTTLVPSEVYIKYKG